MIPKRIVEEGYDRIAEQYCAWAAPVRTDERKRYTSILLEHIASDADVLELGCGTGLPTTYELAQRFVVTGVDLSARHVAMARQNVPHGTFIHVDMSQVDFPPMSFDAVAAFYSLVHVPRYEHPRLLHKIARWLRCRGLFVATLWPDANEATFADDWFGRKMYWSGFDSETSRKLVRAAGMDLVRADEETADEFGEAITFLWIVTQRPSGSHEASRRTSHLMTGR